ncbi:kinase-like domain-containing protein [Cristinia sonorae]|uniref:Kinase-like domain-containing protein n=1 Tax=Cristinia sonorae TaxID=1940300 RepID=A0A8K0URK2_9AGAR|nr:kinase-like domain-containing protein [Cristinia sonorae]
MHTPSTSPDNRTVLSRMDEAELLESPGKAQAALDKIWNHLDRPIPDIATGSLIRNPDPQDDTYREKLRRLSVKIAIHHNILPTSFTLKGVKCTDARPCSAGSFSEVFNGTYSECEVALKRLRVYTMMSVAERKKVEMSFCRESLLWKNLKHKHVVPFLGVANDVFHDTICMVIPWMEKGNLRHQLNNLPGRDDYPSSYSTSVLTLDTWLHQTALGLTYLHDEGIVHGDLHTGNLLVDGAGHVCLSDFGMSVISDATSYNYGSIHGGGASRWCAPELFEPEEFGLTSRRPITQSDIYAFACVAIELYTTKPPFPDLTNYQVPMRVMKGMRPPRPSYPESMTISDELWSLVEDCWLHDFDQRPSALTVAQTLGNIVDKEQAVIADCNNPQFIADNLHLIVSGRKCWRVVKGPRAVVWPPELEAALVKGLELYKPSESHSKRTIGRFPMRNKFISDYIFQGTGKRRSPKQVGSRLQILRDTRTASLAQTSLAPT